MGAYKRGSVFYIDYYFKGRRIREKVGINLKQAETVLAKRKIEIAENRFLDKKKEEQVLFSDFAGDYLELCKKNKRSWESDRLAQKYSIPFFEGKYLSEIMPQDVEKYKAWRMQSVSPASVNRELASLKHLFNIAIQWEKAEKNPVSKVKMFVENNQRNRFLSQDEYKLLLMHSAPHVKAIIEIAVNTGMRRGEILGLKWADIDLKNGMIYVQMTKNDTPKKIPINEVLMETFANMHKRIGNPYLFCHADGKPIKDIKTGFCAAVRRAGIENFRFHDLRHTAGSWLAMSGADLRTIQDVLGLKTLALVARYSHITDTHKRDALNRMGQIMVTNRSQTEKKRKASGL
jgi:integrase